MRRRRFLTSFAAVVATGCTGAGDDLVTNTSTTQRSPDSGPSATSLPTPSTSSESPTVPAPSALPAVQPLPSPPSPLGPDGFGFGVASGDPDATSVVLWTRLVGELPIAVPVVWEVAIDAEFTHLVATGEASTTVDHGHSLHVVADGLTSAGTWWYRFRSGDRISAIGRTRTMPGPGDPAPVRIGASSCQLRETGHWSAHRDVARAELDLFVWLGDYIYEGGGSSSLPGRAHEGGTVDTLAGYRLRYGQYRLDPLLQASHAAHPWFVLWDDHEVVNDYDDSVDPARRAAAYQAWWEFMPVRLPPPDATRPAYDIYRSVDMGDRLRLIGTDVRQYANATTLFGEPQKAWLASELDHGATWTLLASPVISSGINIGSDEVLLPYTLDGYPAERQWLGSQLANRPGRVLVSGDLHAASAFEFSPDRRDVDSPTVATEFMAPAISSRFPERFAAAAPLLPLLNSHMKLFDLDNGWLALRFDAAEVVAEFRQCLDVTDPDAPFTVTHRFAVALGDPALIDLD